jgi:hypothetical protein
MVRIDSVKQGEITINGKAYFSDMTIFWDGRLMYRRKSRVFGIEEFLKIIESEATDIVVGTGLEGSLSVTEEVRQVAEDKGITIFVDQTKKAVKIFNGLIADGKRAVAVMQTTG